MDILAIIVSSSLYFYNHIQYGILASIQYITFTCIQSITFTCTQCITFTCIQCITFTCGRGGLVKVCIFYPSSQEYSALTFKRGPWFLNWYKTNFILYPLRLHYGNLMLILVHSALPWAHKSFISAPPRDETIRDIAKLCPA